MTWHSIFTDDSGKVQYPRSNHCNPSGRFLSGSAPNRRAVDPTIIVKNLAVLLTKSLPLGALAVGTTMFRENLALCLSEPSRGEQNRQRHEGIEKSEFAQSVPVRLPRSEQIASDR